MSDIFVDVDVQHDFCAGDGALPVPDSPNAMFRVLTEHAVAAGIPIVGSVDSHAYDAWEFASNDNLGPNGENPQFPDHCVKGTPGWLKISGSLPPRFRFVPNVETLPINGLVDELTSRATQALYFEKEVYSLFANPLAEPLLRAMIDRLTQPRFIVYGVATDYCVKAAALGLRERGYHTTLLTDAIAGITVAGVEQALDEMRAAGVTMTTVADVTGR